MVAPFMLKVNAGAYSFEVANPRHQHEYKIWEDIELPDDKVIIPGLIGPSKAKPSNSIAHRLGSASAESAVEVEPAKYAINAGPTGPRQVVARVRTGVIKRR